ncbi:hypothetical protein NF865_06565 [Thermococcus aggregans]|uniref:Uncharacterized protein n=1 Tax=Thermococcus aggregans TaxID=110163 RepID=A0A9E7MW53_THEAG|nr:hypothetical protein [Thermococcus aggregans]USS40008.1 hypothetical protein NF865_06565 [Thermococcus aggregans]
MFATSEIEKKIVKIRKENGFPVVPFVIDEIRYDKESDKLFIIARDRSDKSAIIGNSFVIGKLKEELGVKQVTVYSKLDLIIKRKKLEENLKKIKGTFLEFLVPIIEAEFNFPPRKWPKLNAGEKALVFLSFNAKAMIGFAEKVGLKAEKIGIKYTFPKMEYEAIEGSLKELFFPDEKKLTDIAEERGIRIVIGDFPFDLKINEGIALLNPLRFFHIGFFEAKYFFGFEKPVRVDKEAMIDFVMDMVAEGLMESTDGANLIWWAMKKR